MNMETRGEFHVSLQELIVNLRTLSNEVERAIDTSTDALIKQDIQLAKKVIDNDKQINEKSFALQDTCLMVLAQQAPLASDLRLIVSITSIVMDLERIADHAAGNAKICLLIGKEKHVKELVDIPIMNEKVKLMLIKAMNSFINKVESDAASLQADDDVIDALYKKVYNDLVALMIKNPQSVEACTRLLWVAHNFERMADRTTNIGERSIFYITGEFPQENTEY